MILAAATLLALPACDGGRQASDTGRPLDSSRPDTSPDGDGSTDADDTSTADVGDADRTCDSALGCRTPLQGTPPDECPSGRFAGSDYFAGDGICLPETPRGLTADDPCPSGEYAGADVFQGKGICRPKAPELADWSCSESWNNTPAFVDANGERAVPEGVEGFDVCTPPALPDSCPRGTIAPAGASECQQQGTDCPRDDQWPTPSTLRGHASGFSGDIHYVDDADGSGGAGTRDDPYRAIADALEAAAAGDIVALGRGSHRETVDTEKRIALVGACVPETTLAPPSDSTPDRVVDLEHSAGATVANLTITGPGNGVFVRDPSGDVHLEAVTVREARGEGVLVRGNPATTHLDRVAVRSTRPASSGNRGFGLKADYDAPVRIRESVVDANHDVGIYLVGVGDKAPDVTLADSVVRRTRPRRDGWVGSGLHALEGTTLTVERSIFDANGQHGVYVSGDGSRADISQSIVTDGSLEKKGVAARGVVVDNEGRLEADRLLIARNDSSGLVLGNVRQTSPGEASVDNVVLRHNGGIGGVTLNEKSALDGDGVVVFHGPYRGLSVTGAESSLTLTDGIVSRVGTEKNAKGSAFYLNAGEMQLERVIATHNDEEGMRAREKGARAQLTDVSIRETGIDSVTWGLMVRQGVRVEGTRVEITDTAHVAATVSGGESAILDLDQARIADSSPVSLENNTTGTGQGVFADLGGQLSLTRSLVEGHAQAGIFGRGRDGTGVELTDTVIRDTQPVDVDADEDVGVGLALNEGADATLRRVAIRHNYMTGLDVHGAGSQLDVRDLSITHAPDLEPTPVGRYGFAVGGNPKLANFARVRVVSAPGVGLYLKNAREMRIGDLVVRETLRNADGLGDGLYAFFDSELTVERALLQTNGRHGVVVSNAEAVLSDLALIGNGGAGLVRQAETTADIERLRAEANGAGREQCSQQCYESPPDPEKVDPPSGL